MSEDSEDNVLIKEIKNDNGVVIKKISMKNGIPHGEMLLFNENEEKTHQLTYENGILEGPAVFFESGMPIMNTNFKDGAQHGNAEFFQNGIRIASATFENGVFHGEFIAYDQMNNVTKIMNYKDGKQDGDTKSFYPDGTLLEHSIYKNNKIEGDYLKFYPNGSLMEKSTYENGIAVGYIDNYDIKGNLKSRKEM